MDFPRIGPELKKIGIGSTTSAAQVRHLLLVPGCVKLLLRE